MCLTALDLPAPRVTSDDRNTHPSLYICFFRFVKSNPCVRQIMDTQRTHIPEKNTNWLFLISERKNRHIIDTALFTYINGRIARFVRFGLPLILLKEKLENLQSHFSKFELHVGNGCTAKRMSTCFNRVKGRSSCFWFYDRQPTDFDGNISDPWFESDADDFCFFIEIKWRFSKWIRAAAGRRHFMLAFIRLCIRFVIWKCLTFLHSHRSVCTHFQK